MLRAVFFDLGSTLWDDYPSELAYWECVSQQLHKHGIPVSLQQLIEHVPVVIASYSPSLTRALIWHFVSGDHALYDEIVAETKQRMLERNSTAEGFRSLNPLFEGVHELLDRLSARLPLAVVSQNVVEAAEWMRIHDIEKYFSHISLSGSEQLYKPDPRLYLRTCTALGIAPQSVAMVGDRLDNDIWPANRLNMTSIRVLADPYRIQQPRYHTDVPDYTVERTRDLMPLLESLLARG